MPCNSKVIKGTLGGFLIKIFMVLPARESNPSCWDRIPASYHLTTLTFHIQMLYSSNHLLFLMTFRAHKHFDIFLSKKNVNNAFHNKTNICDQKYLFA